MFFELENKDEFAKIIFIPLNGTPQERVINFNPYKNEIAKLLGDRATFVGKWEEEQDDIIPITTLTLQQSINREILPFPFDKEVIQGPIIIVRMNENVEPMDMTLNEYAAIKRKHPPRRRSARLLAQELSKFNIRT